MKRTEARAIAQAVAAMVEACSATPSPNMGELEDDLVEALCDVSPTMETSDE
jgi:hypothetical protein